MENLFGEDSPHLEAMRSLLRFLSDYKVDLQRFATVRTIFQGLKLIDSNVFASELCFVLAGH